MYLVINICDVHDIGNIITKVVRENTAQDVKCNVRPAESQWSNEDHKDNTQMHTQHMVHSSSHNLAWGKLQRAAYKLHVYTMYMYMYIHVCLVSHH